MKNIITEILEERLRQVNKGYDAPRDDTHDKGELAFAAAVYAIPQYPRQDGTLPPYFWPFENSAWQPKDRRTDLIRAAALIVAEIERLDRYCETTIR